MENKGLLFIPDISGFTKFVNETDIDHSRLIIQELLEILVDANEMGLEVSEIEGDAILFYKFGDPPSLEQVYTQVEKMFSLFHKSLVTYNLRKYCQCKACLSAVNLSLKVITHYGEFSTYNVKTFRKLIGKDVIVAHQLLKNSIDDHEYWMVTKSLSGDNDLLPFKNWMEWMSSSKETETGDVTFHYTQLSALKNEINSDPPQRTEPPRQVRVLSVSKEYQTNIIALFRATGDFNTRPRWREGVIRVEDVGHLLPRIGMRCRCILENGEVVTYSNSFSYHPDRIEFSETDENRSNLTYYTLEKMGAEKIKFTLDYYLPPNIFRQVSFRLFKKKEMEDSLRKSLDNIDGLLKEINIPEEELEG